MERTLYLECYSGISGDMVTAALLDLGAEENVLREVLDSLPLKGYHVEISRVTKSGIDACDFDVILENEDNHDHDMEYLYGHLHGNSHSTMHEHSHDEAHKQSHDGMHGHAHGHVNEEGQQHTHSHVHGNEEGQQHTHSHVHRGMKEIREIIEQGNMTEGARRLALQIFTVLAEAESKAHNVPVEEVHFHEVGAVDSIVDIVSAAVCLDNLNIRKVIVPELWEGRGTVRCQHGILPVPVPAVTEIIQAYELPIRITDIMGELVTPTGAAVVAAVRTSGQLPKRFLIHRLGLGAGKREYECAGLLRAMLIEEMES
ncbi:MAG: DUF111 family protein [Lachnospiraceae bacterium]|nr:DUF111 family protein [Lachnospiraceae bacterium]